MQTLEHIKNGLREAYLLLNLPSAQRKEIPSVPSAGPSSMFQVGLAGTSKLARVLVDTGAETSFKKIYGPIICKEMWLPYICMLSLLLICLPSSKIAQAW